MALGCNDLGCYWQADSEQSNYTTEHYMRQQNKYLEPN